MQYFTLSTCEQYAFYRVPKMLIKDSRYADVSSDAKLLYGLMLDRMSLSRANEWADEQGHVFMYYGQSDIMADMSCREGKAAKMVKELLSAGLIEIKNQGQGKSRIIYVKNFIEEKTADVNSSSLSQMPRNAKIAFQNEDTTLPLNTGVKHTADTQECPESLLEMKPQNPSALPLSQADTEPICTIQKCENRISRNAKIASQEMRKSHLKKCENRTQNNNKYNNTKLSNTESIHQSFYQKDGLIAMRKRMEEDLGVSLYDDGAPEKAAVQEIIGIMLEVFTTQAQTITISGDRVPIELVRAAIKPARLSDIESVITSINSGNTEIKNIKAYIITTLYNHMLTANNAIANKVSASMGV